MSSENDHLSRKFRITNVWAGCALARSLARFLLARKKVEDANTILVAQKIKETWDLIAKETSHAAFFYIFKKENKNCGNRFY